jgi:hypothetical protein
MKFAAIILVSLVASCSARNISFENCGGTNVITSVDVEPCASEPCQFEKGSKAVMTAQGVFEKDAASGTLTVTVELGGVEVPYPGIDSNVCNKISCPVKKGQPFEIQYEIDVADYFPEVSSFHFPR